MATTGDATRHTPPPQWESARRATVIAIDHHFHHHSHSIPSTPTRSRSPLEIPSRHLSPGRRDAHRGPAVPTGAPAALPLRPRPRPRPRPCPRPPASPEWTRRRATGQRPKGVGEGGVALAGGIPPVPGPRSLSSDLRPGPNTWRPPPPRPRLSPPSWRWRVGPSLRLPPQGKSMCSQGGCPLPSCNDFCGLL